LVFRWKIAIGLAAYQLVSSGCHHAEIDLGDLLPEAGQTGSSEAVGGANGAEDEPGQSSEGGGYSEVGVVAGSGQAAGTRPRVLSTSPGNGERGVLSDAKIVIHFSESMDPARTAAAVDLEGIPVTVEWNELWTELTVIPSLGLGYAQGADPELVEAMAYSLKIDDAATDVSGTPLDRTYTAKFYTSRQLWTTLPGVDRLMGYAIDSDEPRDSTVFVDPLVGDSTDEAMKGFITVDLGALPPETQAATTAVLSVSQYEVSGQPYEMGSMLLEHVEFSSLEDVLLAPAKTSFGTVFADAETKNANVKVTSAVQTQLAERAGTRGLVQFRFAFEQAVNPNGTSDYVRLRPLSLEVTYLMP
jgi:hypothetical protein